MDVKSLALTLMQELLILLIGILGILTIVAFFLFIRKTSGKKKVSQNEENPKESIDRVTQESSPAYQPVGEEIRNSLDPGPATGSSTVTVQQVQVAPSTTSRSEIPETQLKQFDIRKLAPKQPVVGLVGFSGSGKTVFCATLNHFINKINKDSSIWCSQEKGSQYMEQLLDALLVNHTFPEKTQMGVSREIELKIHKGSKSILMQVNDLSGEVFDRLKNTESTDWAYFFLTQSKSQNSLVGPYAYLLYSKAYILAIDCAQLFRVGIERICLHNASLWACGCKEKQKIRRTTHVSVYESRHFAPGGQQP